jgi:hypothetical protein
LKLQASVGAGSSYQTKNLGKKCDKVFNYFSKELNFFPENFPEEQGIS